MKFLIVDDSKAMRGIVKRGLQQAGYGEHELLDVGSAKAARKLIEQAVPDLMFVDINMPEVTGLELVESLQKDGIDVAFGISSAERSMETLNQARSLGAQFFLQKPFSPDDIHLALEPVIRGLNTVIKLKAENRKLRDLVEQLTAEKRQAESAE